MKIENAIILAAGVGKRLHPYTDNCPKPLLEVDGLPIIEHTIQSLKKKGINDITIVIGYKAQNFFYLQDKYGVNLMYNKNYETTNNIMSLYIARNYIKNTLILDADLYIKNEDTILTDVDNSCWTCYYSEDKLNEWAEILDKNKKILSTDITGNASRNYLLTFAYICEDIYSLFKQKLSKDIEAGMIDTYWDNVVLLNHKQDFEVYANMINKFDVVEFDTIEEYERYINA